MFSLFSFLPNIYYKSEPSPVALGGTDYWIIGLVIGILVILMMIILIFMICRQKTLEGTYQGKINFTND